jgi:hypothetical protein
VIKTEQKELTDQERLERAGYVVGIKTFNGLHGINVDVQVFNRSGATWVIELIQANAAVLWPEPIKETEENA